MKNMRKLLAMVLAVIMVMSLATTAFATDITIENGASGSEYAAFRLLNATDGGDGKFAYTLNTKYTTVLQGVTGKTTEADIVAYIAEQKNDAARTFADAVYAQIVENNIEADATATNNTFADVAQGYYLIAETKVGDATDTFSLVMLDTAGQSNITVNTKEDKPTVEKKIVEGNDRVDYTDKGVGEVVNYEITGTVSSKYADYDSYYYSFEDTMSGLTLDTASIKVTINGTDVTNQFVIAADADSFTATANLKELNGVTISADTKVIVTYSATLNENAVSESTGNPNEVILKYENDPYHEGDGDNDPKTPNKPEKPGETPKDVNVVFTFDTIVNKVDKDGKALNGAGFTLYKQNGDSWTQVGNEISGVTEFKFEKLDAGTYKLVETKVPAGYNKAEDIIFEIEPTYTTDEAGVTTLTGLVVKNDKGENVSTGESAAFSATVANGEVETDVVNNAGTELPSTGGMGTTLFYVFGAIMMVGAAVLLVTKKRMASAE